MPRPPAYLRPYLDAASIHGGRFEATLWRSRAFQERRFEVLVEIADLARRCAERPLRVVDAGAGRGDFAAFLKARGVPIESGVGIEAVEPLRSAAARRRQRGWTYIAGDFLRERDLFARLEPDLVFFSGSLNTFPIASLRRTVQRAFEAARIGVAFNMLSASGARRGERTAPARRVDPVALLAWALEITPLVALRQEYLGGHDATIWMGKGPPAAR